MLLPWRHPVTPFAACKPVVGNTWPLRVTRWRAARSCRWPRFPLPANGACGKRRGLQGRAGRRFPQFPLATNSGHWQRWVAVPADGPCKQTVWRLPADYPKGLPVAHHCFTAGGGAAMPSGTPGHTAGRSRGVLGTRGVLPPFSGRWRGVASSFLAGEEPGHSVGDTAAIGGWGCCHLYE